MAQFRRRACEVLETAKQCDRELYTYPALIYKSYNKNNPEKIDYLRKALEGVKGETAYDLTWMNFVSILRCTSCAGTATWQYVLPNKGKTKVADAFSAFQQQTECMCEDMLYMQSCRPSSKVSLLLHDARKKSVIRENSIDLIITSPPYANNYDYGDATRLELSVLGEIIGWGDLQKKVRMGLVRSCSQMVSGERKQTFSYLESPLRQDSESTGLKRQEIET